MRALLRCGLLAAGFWSLACGGNGTGPVEGDVTLVLTAAPSGTGALLFRVTGQVKEVNPIGALRVASAPAGPQATRMVVSGAIATGDLVRIRIPDLDLAETYTVTIEQAASGADFSLLDPVQFAVTIRR